MALLSPGVEVREYDLSLTPSIASSSFAGFAGKFMKGDGDTIVYISSGDTYKQYFGKPTDTNYNDWFQVFNFLQYANSAFVVRAIDRTGVDNSEDTTETVDADAATDDVIITSSAVSSTLVTNQIIRFGIDTTVYKIDSVAGNVITLKEPLQSSVTATTPIFLCHPSYNAIGEVEVSTGTAVTSSALVPYYDTIANSGEFEIMFDSIPFISATNTKFKIMARNPGTWGNSILVCIATKADFDLGNVQAFPGILLNNQFDYSPSTTEVAILIMDESSGEIAEKYILSLVPGTKDFNQKSVYIEDVINRQSSYIYIKDNVAVTGMPKSKTNTNVLKLEGGNNGNPGKAEIINAYKDNFGNKEEIEVDILIANELCNKEVAELCAERGDVIGYGGCLYGDMVGLKPAVIITNLLTYVTTGNMNIENKYFSLAANYKKQYDTINDKYRWVNIAGDVAGIRAQVTSSREPWIAAAGIERAQIKNVDRLAWNPNNGYRDLLYKNKLNPIVSFPGQGIMKWGQKTMQSRSSAFDRENIRCLFNYLERSVSKMSKSMVFEANDEFTRNYFVSICKPLFERVRSGRGIDSYKIVCDETNNTPIVRNNHQFIATFLIKPTYTAEFITLNFVAVGASVEFSEVTGSF